MTEYKPPQTSLCSPPFFPYLTFVKAAKLPVKSISALMSLFHTSDSEFLKVGLGLMLVLVLLLLERPAEGRDELQFALRPLPFAYTVIAVCRSLIAWVLLGSAVLGFLEIQLDWAVATKVTFPHQSWDQLSSCLETSFV